MRQEAIGSTAVDGRSVTKRLTGMKGYCCDLSPVQEGMYFHHAHCRNAVYLEQLACDIHGPLDIAVARRCIERLVREHDILRTVFTVKRPKGLRQVVLPFAEVDLPLIDATQASDPIGFVEALLDHESRLNLDLSRRASRCKIVQLGPETFVFIWTYHHIIMDSWSLLMLQRQFTMLYAGALNGAEIPAIAARPYREYVSWTRRRDQAATFRFWRRYLGRAASRVPLVLPSETISENTIVSRTPLLRDTHELLAALKKQHKTTATVVFLAAWSAWVLYRDGREADIIACVYANRLVPIKAAGTIAGLFVNSLPLRTTRYFTTIEQIDHIHRAMMEWPRHGWMALSDIMATGGLTAYNISSFVNFTIDQPTIDNEYSRTLPIRLDRVRYREQAHFAVCLDIDLAEDRPSLAIRYDRRLGSFDAAEIAEDLARVLTVFRDRPRTPLGDLVIELKKPALFAETDFDF